MAFTSAAGKERHWQRAHLGKMLRSAELISAEDEGGHRVSCPFCHRVAVDSLKELREHVKREHMESERCCVLCGKECGSKERIQEHIQEHRGDPLLDKLLYACETCGARFLSEYALVSHRKEAHSVNLKHECR